MNAVAPTKESVGLYGELVLHLMKGGIDFHARDAVAAAAANYLRQKLTNAPPVDADATVLNALRTTGFSWLPNAFSKEEIAEIHTYLGDKTAYYWDDNVAHPSTIKGTMANRVPNRRFASFDQDVVSACPPFARIAHDPKLLQIAEAYLEAPPTISILTSWWSYPSTAVPGGMQNFHHDRDDFRQVKFFVYLTDVDEGDGPHEFIDNTHRANLLDKYVNQRWTSETDRAQIWKYLGVHRKPDDLAAALFPKEWFRKITGPTGSTFMEDTHGTHKGVPPQKGGRLVFQICYSLIPKPNALYETIPRPAGLTPTPKAAYATRYFYK